MSKHAAHACLLPALAACILVLGHIEDGNAKNYLCEQPYALCTSAPCVPQPGDPTEAICSCDVEQGKSMATELCDTLLPSTDADGVRTVYSTFSLVQAAQGKKVMSCPAGTPWTWCLNKRCTVDPANAEKAICACDVIRTGAWITFGGGCDSATCETGYWSGAALADFESGNAFVTQALGLDKSPAQMCQ
jgi:hypothetical protein